MDLSSAWSIAPFLFLATAAAVSGALFMPGPWYKALNKPWWTPPDWLFPVAWTVLYLMIAVAGWYAWLAEGIGPAVITWGVGLILNGLWSYFMFERKSIRMALIDVAALWLATAAFVYLTWTLEPLAAYIFLLYLAWVSFAGFLNFKVWRMN